MGIRVSKGAEGHRVTNYCQQTQTTVLCDSSIEKITTPQRNDNATKLDEHQRSILYSPAQTCTSSSCSLSSEHKPQLGSSPLPIPTKNDVHTNKLLDEADQFWFERRYIPDESVTRTRNLSIIRPPWKPSSVHCEIHPWQITPSQQIKRRHTNSRRASSYGYTAKKASSSNTLACFGDTRIQTGEAHLRRCTAAQRVHSQKPDLLDSVSVDFYPGAHGTDSQFYENEKSNTNRLQSAYCCSRSSESHQRTGRLKNDRGRSRPKKKFDSISLHLEHSDISPPSPPNLRTGKDDSFPLRYIFYIDDKPTSLQAFTSGGRIATLARDCRCRVYFHVQQRQPVLFGSSAELRQGDTRTIEPVLFYRGSRVRPVTVAAPSMDRLTNFLEALDMYYPQFHAGAFLTDQLVAGL